MKADQQLIRTVDVHDRSGNVVGTKDVVLYAGLLNQAHEEGLARLKTAILQIPSEENGRVDGETVPRAIESRVVRSLKRFFRGEMGFRYRGGLIVDWNGRLASRAAALVGPLSSYYSTTYESCEMSGTES